MVICNPVVASVDGNDITIASQDPDSDGYLVSGSGSMNAAGTVLSITFTLSDGTNTETWYCSLHKAVNQNKLHKKRPANAGLFL